MLRLVALLSIISTTGCFLYTGDDEPPPPCEYGYAAGAPQYYETRDPYTGQCYPTGGGGGCPIDSCGPCAYDDIAPAGPGCYGACSGLDEYSCTATPGCHAAYDSNSRADALPQFTECWDIAPQPVQTGGQCEGLDAWTCAMHDDCVGMFDTQYGPDDGVTRQFEFCASEGPVQGCNAVDCGPGSHCEEQCEGDCTGGTMGGGGEDCAISCYTVCVPDEPYSCATVDCGPGYMCVEQCEPGDPSTGTMTGACYPSCVQIPNEPGECYGPVACDALPPSCPTNTTPGVLNGCWTGYCIPTNQCGPQDPGTCDAATCTQPPPACPSDTVAGVKNGCYTGYCIPASSCPQLPCEALDESACLSRSECTPVYNGQDCTCYPDGTCSCTSTDFARCETWWL